ncbi:MAG: hypothetical protein CL927_00330 [Deltaproteobacteria bacterium]|nr:hypothetical protein [Deltaproteobacteria bacterium]
MSDSLVNSWEVTLREAYLDGRANVFLLHGAVGDFQWIGSEDGFVSLSRAVSILLGRSREFVIRIDGAGDAEMDATQPAASTRAAFAWARPGTRNPSEVLQGNPVVLLATLGRLLQSPTHPCGVVVSQADLLLGAQMDALSRAATAKVRQWLDMPEIRQTNNAAVLIADDPDRLAMALRHHPRLCRIEVGLPSESACVAALRGELADRIEHIPDDALVTATRGQSLVQVAALCSRLVAASPGEISHTFPAEDRAGAPAEESDAPPTPSFELEPTDG